MFILLVQVEAKPESVAEFRAAVRENAAQSVAHDPGCLRFDVSEVEGATNRFVFYEVYTSEEAWQAHRESPHFAAYNAVAARALVSREFTRLKPVEGGHLPKSTDGL